MNEDFIKIKKQCLWEALIKSAAIGLSAALLVVGVFLLAFGLAEIDLHWAVYIAIGVVIFAAGGGIAYFFLRPTDIKVAKRYDKEFSLNERVQTMVEYSDKEGDIVQLQREDTAEKIKGLKINPFKLSRIWQYCALCALAVAILFTGVFVPAAALNSDDDPSETVQPEPDPDAFTYDLYMQAAMAELISNVRESSLKEGDKSAVVSALQTLDDSLKEIESKSLMKSYVLATVITVDAITDGANSFRKIHEALTDDNLKQAVKDGVAVFAANGTNFNTYRNVLAFKSRVGNYIEIVLEPILEKIGEDLKVSQIDGLDEKLNSFIGVITSALNESEVSEDDGLYTSFVALRRALRTTCDKVGKGSSNAVLWNEIDKALGDFSINLNSALGEQSYYCVMDLFVRTRLSEIFGIKYSELPEVNKDIEGGSGRVPEEGNDEPGDDPDDTKPGDGGGANLNEIYGSDDVIYYPDAADYVIYGQVLDEYYTRFSDKMLQGDAPEEIKKLVAEYFKSLYSGIEEDTDEN